MQACQRTTREPRVGGRRSIEVRGRKIQVWQVPGWWRGGIERRGQAGRKGRYRKVGRQVVEGEEGWDLPPTWQCDGEGRQ